MPLLLLLLPLPTTYTSVTVASRVLVFTRVFVLPSVGKSRLATTCMENAVNVCVCLRAGVSFEL